jgi:Putative bacterial sensory transduction regulator
MAGPEQLAALRRTMEHHLEASFGGVRRDDDGDFVIHHGSAQTHLRPLELPGGGTAVRVWSITNVGVRVDPELTRFLLTENRRLAFGGFGLDEARRSVVFAHSLIGDADSLARSELEAAVGAVATTADEYDDEIKARFGGSLFAEGV